MKTIKVTNMTEMFTALNMNPNGFDTAISIDDVDDDFAPLFYDRDNEGNMWGEIKDIQFVNEYTYKMIY